MSVPTSGISKMPRLNFLLYFLLAAQENQQHMWHNTVVEEPVSSVQSRRCHALPPHTHTHPP